MVYIFTYFSFLSLNCVVCSFLVLCLSIGSVFLGEAREIEIQCEFILYKLVILGPNV